MFHLILKNILFYNDNKGNAKEVLHKNENG